MPTIKRVGERSSPSTLLESIKDLTARYPKIARALAIFTAYGVWVAVFKLVALTLVTYFVTSTSRGIGNVRFEEINETYGSGELTVLAIAALTFTALFPLLNPLTRTKRHEIFSPDRFEKRFLPGFMHGAVLALGVILAFLLAGIYRYLGAFIQVDEAPLAAASILVRTLSIAVLVYCEEFVFRGKILGLLRSSKEDGSRDLAAVAATAAFFVAVKVVQFDLALGWMHSFTLFLIAMSLGLRRLSDGDFNHGAGYWAAILIVFHPFLSLPIFGSEFTGLVLVKYQSLTQETTRFFTGGNGGPLASFAFQLLLIIDTARSAISYKKKAFSASHVPLD